MRARSLAVRRFKNRRPLLAGLFAVGLSGVVTAQSRPAHAQPKVNAIPDGNGAGFDTHLFRPALDSKGFFHTNGTDILGANDISLGLVLDYGRNLLRVGDTDSLFPVTVETL